MQEGVQVHEGRGERPPPVEKEGVQLAIGAKGILDRDRLRLRDFGLCQAKNGGLPCSLASKPQSSIQLASVLQPSRTPSVGRAPGAEWILSSLMDANTRLKWNFLTLPSEGRTCVRRRRSSFDQPSGRWQELILLSDTNGEPSVSQIGASHGHCLLASGKGEREVLVALVAFLMARAPATRAKLSSARQPP